MKLESIISERFKEKPADCAADSQALLTRGGYFKQVSAGIFTLNNVMLRIMGKIERIIREEMDNTGGQEVLFPVVMPGALWEESGRYAGVGSELLRFKDRNGSPMVLGMTHEEAAVHFAREYGGSYTKYPFMIYQIQTKFRDEARPRNGLIRAREFRMKDAYSFHTSQEDLERFYALCFQAYERIFKRAGLDNVLSVSSDSGIMGGNVSHEFILPSPIGEDYIAVCGECAYRVNAETAERIAVYDCTEAAGEMKQIPAKIADNGICPGCGRRALSILRGIEVGNIFQLGIKYTEAMGMLYQDKDGKLKHPIMGCYGIGIGRLAASICEAHHDERGPIWPMAIAPWQAHICALRADEPEVKEYADKLYNELLRRGIEVLYDDRVVSAGIMFSDADLMGVPVRVIVSPRNMLDSCCEIASRDGKVGEKVGLNEAAGRIERIVRHGA